MNYSFRIPTAATASEVAPALLHAVYAAAGSDPAAAGQNVHWNSVLHHFVQLTGLSMDSFGKDKRGYPRLKTAISGAWGAIKKEGLATPSPRRTYCLSPIGATMAMSGATAPTPAPSTSEVVVEAPTPEPTTTVVVIEPKGDVGVSWVGPSGSANATHTAYETDAYFRSLAAEKTRCFGKWSARASACKGCPLASLCKGAQTTMMAEIASKMDAEFAKGLAVTSAPATTPATTPEVVEAAPAPSLPDGAKVMPVAFETVCSHCGKVCPEGVDAVHLPGKGVYHTECAASI
jgi:hypothetical protein